MGEARAARRVVGSALVVLFGAFAAAFVRADASVQDEARTCFVCHADAEAKSSAGTPVFVDPDVFKASVHAEAGLGCIGCHTDLAGVEEFPHAPDLASVNCAHCHPAYGPDSMAGVHGVLSPRLAAKPVLCGDCHGYHDVLPSSSLGSRVHASNVPATCGRCHPKAGPNFARGRVHDLGDAGRRSPSGAVRAVYRLVIGITIVLCFAFIAVDIVRRRAER
jgi:Cytochrome c3